MDGRPNRRNKAALSNYFVVVWALPLFFQMINSSQLPRDETLLMKNYGHGSSSNVAKRLENQSFARNFSLDRKENYEKSACCLGQLRFSNFTLYVTSSETNGV